MKNDLCGVDATQTERRVQCECNHVCGWEPFGEDILGKHNEQVPYPYNADNRHGSFMR